MKKSTKQIFAAFALLACTASLVACGAKDNTNDYDYIKNKGELVIGITDFAPMDYKEGKDSDWIGFDADLARLVCKELGVTAKFVEIDWNKKETELKSKNIDCIWNGFTVREDLEANIDFTVHYMMNKQVVVVKNANKGMTMTSLNDKKVSIAAESESAGQDAIEEYFPKATFISVNAQTDALTEVAATTSTAAVMDYVMALSYVGKGTYADLTIIDSIELAYEEYAVGFRKGSDADEKVSEVLKKLYNNGTIKSLAEKYEIGPQVLPIK